MSLIAYAEKYPTLVNALVSYLNALSSNPLRTKMITSGVLSGAAEVAAGKLAGVAPATKATPPGQVSNKKAAQQQPLRLALSYLEAAGLNERAFYMFIYGTFISAPLGHFMTGILQRAFAGKTTARDKIMQIITANLTVTVVANAVYLASIAVINGARSVDAVVATVKASFWQITRITWILNPIILSIAQKYVPSQLWEPFFAIIRFFTSTFFNTIAKKKQMALARKGTKNIASADLKKGAAQGK